MFKISLISTISSRYITIGYVGTNDAGSVAKFSKMLKTDVLIT
jgi:hypothetical protein